MKKTRLIAISMALALPAIAKSQGASFKEYGKGCPSSTNSTCPNNNASAKTLTTILQNINPQLALEVTGTTPVVDGFEIFTQSNAKQNITAWILLPDANGKPDSSKPLGTGTLSVDTALGWYRASFKVPVVVGAAKRYFISWDQGKSARPITKDPIARQGLHSNYMQRQLVNNRLQWVTPRALRRWAWKIVCKGASQTPRMTSNTEPSLGNSMFSILIRRAAANTPAISIIGDSNTKWGSINLPLDLSPVGAPGCSLLTTPLIFAPTVTDKNGDGSLPLAIPNDKKLKGLKFFAQWMLVDLKANSLKLIFSNGAAGVIGDAE